MIKLIISTLGGGLIGIVAAFITHFCAVRRERIRDQEQRKREFRGYLAELRSRIERLPDNPEKADELFSNYISLIHQFHRERAKVMGDFLPVADFIRLSDNLGSLRYSAIKFDSKKRDPRDVIAESIDALIHFTSPAGSDEVRRLL